MLLLSEDFGKHLMGVEDLIEKHSLLVADIVGYGMRVEQINQQAHKFMDEKGPDGSGKLHTAAILMQTDFTLVRNSSLIQKQQFCNPKLTLLTGLSLYLS